MSFPWSLSLRRSLTVAVGLAATALLITASAYATAPSNDNHTSPIDLIAGGSGNTPLSAPTAGATLEPGEPTHAGDAGGASVWFRWTPNFTGTAFVDTLASTFDTVLDVRNPVTYPAANSLIAANDD